MRKTRNPHKVLERLQEILWPLLDAAARVRRAGLGADDPMTPSIRVGKIDGRPSHIVRLCAEALRLSYDIEFDSADYHGILREMAADAAAEQKTDAATIAALRAEVARVLRWGTDSSKDTLHERHGELVMACLERGEPCDANVELHVVRLALDSEQSWSADTIEWVAEVVREAGYGPRPAPPITGPELRLLQRLKQGLPLQDRHWKTAETLLRRGLVEPGPGAPVLNEAGKAALAEGAA